MDSKKKLRSSIKKNLKKQKQIKLFPYKVSKEIYKKALKEIDSERKASKTQLQTALLCHSQMSQYFNGCDDPNTIGHLMEGAKQALEDRDFRSLYEIIKNSLESKVPDVLQQLHEYMYLAISHDPLIEDKEKVMTDFLLRVKLMKDNSERVQCVKYAHSFGKCSTEEEDRVDGAVTKKERLEEDSDFSEASLDASMFVAIKTELDD